ncbi:MAG: GntR family transcriptional regulator [Bacteroidetes bacterium]|nr:GntR family transcriptional regulator [Bacteroidota bacterium]
MADVGLMNKMVVVREAEHGIYLTDETETDVLLPIAAVPEGCKIDDEIEVFVYRDSEDRIIATTLEPYAMVGDFAYLKVVSVSKVGAFLDWGLHKDLMVPFKEQKHRMNEGQSYVVFVYLDEDTDRVVASSKLHKFLNDTPAIYREGEEVDLVIFAKNDLGYEAIINLMHTGMIYENEVFQALHIGEQVTGYIKKIRSDGKIDLSLQKTGYKNMGPNVELILDYLNEHDGSMNITDKSQAELIYATFGISKKNFKKAIGALYKQKIISIGDDVIKLT